MVGRGLGWQTVGLIPPMFNLNDHPTQIPPSEILGPVVQNCRIQQKLAVEVHFLRDISTTPLKHYELFKQANKLWFLNEMIDNS